MKRFIIGICALTLLLAGGIGVSTSFSLVHAPTTELLQQAAQAAIQGEQETALSFSAQAQQRWENFWHFTAAFADHAPMDEIDGLFARLPFLAQQQDLSEYAALCAQLSQMTNALANCHNLRWWTLL